MAHGGADGGRSHGGGMAVDSRGPTNGGGAGDGGGRGVEPMSQGDAEDPAGDKGGAQCSSERGWGGRSAAETERLRTQVELTGGRSPTELVGQSDNAQPEERSPEAMAGQRPTKAEPEGQGSLVDLVDRQVTVEARELGAEVELLILRAEAESGPRRLEAEVRDTQAPATLEDGRPTGLALYR